MGQAQVLAAREMAGKFGLPRAPARAERPSARGKFFFLGEEKFYLRGVGTVPEAFIARHASDCTRSWRVSKATARARVTSVAPRESAPGIVVTSIDCLALVGQPIPQ